jgi:hypothetical protein
MITIISLPDGSLTLDKNGTITNVPVINPTVEDLLAATIKAITDLNLKGSTLTRNEVVQVFKAICPERPLSSKVFNQPEFQNILCAASPH